MDSGWMQATYRILDANANRAAEGLRTLEEVARFVWEDMGLTQQLKQMRHDLRAELDRMNSTLLLSSRNTQGDCGTTIQTQQENSRRDHSEVASAASGRVHQALRCLEEFSKIVEPQVSQAIERIRYRAYDILAEVQLRFLSQDSFLSEARLYVLVDCQRTLPEFEELVLQLSSAGVSILQLRDKQASDRKRLEYAQRAIQVLDRIRTRVVMNDRVDLAMAAGASGVHLGQDEMSLRDARRLVGRSMWIGVSTHDMDQVRDAECDGADYIGCGPTFASSTKSFQAFPGLDFLRQVASAVDVPAFAIGGINSTNMTQVLSTGISRVAVSQAVLAAASPKQAARELAALLNTLDEKGLT